MEKLPLSNDPTPRVTFDYAAVPAVTRGVNEQAELTPPVTQHLTVTVRTLRPTGLIGKPNMPAIRLHYEE